MVEIGTAVFFAAVAWWLLATSAYAWTGTVTGVIAAVVMLAAFLYLASISVALAFIDLDTHTLPNRIVLPAYPISAVLLGLAGLLGGEPERLVTSLIGGTALFAAYFAMAFAYPGGMGFGDVKLAGVLGLFLGWLGWGPLAVGAFSAFMLGGLFSLILVIVRRANRRTAIPFGPWMIAGAWVGVFFGERMATAYLMLFGLV